MVMRIDFVVDPEDGVVKKYLAAPESHEGQKSVKVDGMTFRHEPLGPCFTHYGRIEELPLLLREVRITHVIIRDSGREDTPLRGVYTWAGTRAFVTYDSGPNPFWEIKVVGRRLRPALRLHDNVRAQKVWPAIQYIGRVALIRATAATSPAAQKAIEG